MTARQRHVVRCNNPKCGKEFELSPGDLRSRKAHRLFCSRSCAASAPPDITTTRPRSTMRLPAIECDCPVCGKHFAIPRTDLFFRLPGQAACSAACSLKRRWKLALTGKTEPLRKFRFPYTPEGMVLLVEQKKEGSFYSFEVGRERIPISRQDAFSTEAFDTAYTRALALLNAKQAKAAKRGAKKPPASSEGNTKTPEG